MYKIRVFWDVIKRLTVKKGTFEENARAERGDYDAYYLFTCTHMYKW